jgi:hypothetical protein
MPLTWLSLRGNLSRVNEANEKLSARPMGKKTRVRNAPYHRRYRARIYLYVCTYRTKDTYVVVEQHIDQISAWIARSLIMLKLFRQ